jgi:oligopeptide/dipeptide ABC transporter ATP-binding protein
MNENFLSVENVKKYYAVRRGLWRREIVRAVDYVSLKVNQGETYAIVGESGSGKSTLARLVVGLERPDEGRICYLGVNLLDIDKEDRRRFHREVQMVFQNPYASLNPRKRISSILAKPFRTHDIRYNDETLKELLSKVGLTPPSVYLNKYPHELSGGERQRIAIARSLALSPRVVVLDEPISALDVTTKVQILDLLKDLQKQEKLALILVSHELPFLRPIGGHVSVMYNGKILEEGTSEEIFTDAYHPYTIGLLNSILELDPNEAREKGIFAVEGETPSPVNPPPGCRFHPRCPLANLSCSQSEPHMISVSRSHRVACPIAVEKFKKESADRSSIYALQA